MICLSSSFLASQRSQGNRKVSSMVSSFTSMYSRCHPAPGPDGRKHLGFPPYCHDVPLFPLLVVCVLFCSCAFLTLRLTCRLLPNLVCCRPFCVDCHFPLVFSGCICSLFYFVACSLFCYLPPCVVSPCVLVCICSFIVSCFILLSALLIIPALCALVIVFTCPLFLLPNPLSALFSSICI